MALVVKDKTHNYSIYFPESTGNNPSYVITTPAGQTYLSGTGTPTAVEHYYDVSVAIPVAAPSSTVDLQWSITWSYGDIKKTMYFEVADPGLGIDEIYQRELSKYTLADVDYDARCVVSENPTTGTAKLYSGNTLQTSDDIVFESHRLGTQMTVTMPAAYMATGEYILIWDTDVERYVQTINVTPIAMLPLITEIKKLVDRVLRQIDEPQVILDSDINHSLFGGIELINGWHPLTDWTISNIDMRLRQFIIFASSWWLLNSQFMLEADLAFSYSGQQVSLDYDRTGPIESEMGRLWDFLTEHLTKAKKTLLRSVNGRVGLTTTNLGPGGMIIHRNRRIIRSGS